MVHNTLFHSSRRSWRCPYQKHRSFIKWHSVFGRVQHTVDNRRTTSTFDVHHKTSCTSRGPWTSLPPRKIGNTSSGSIACLWASQATTFGTGRARAYNFIRTHWCSLKNNAHWKDCTGPHYNVHTIYGAVSDMYVYHYFSTNDLARFAYCQQNIDLLVWTIYILIHHIPTHIPTYSLLCKRREINNNNDERYICRLDGLFSVTTG